MDNNLRIPILSLIKLLISSLRISKSDLVRNHKAGLRFPRNDHIAQVAVVGFDVALPSPE